MSQREFVEFWTKAPPFFKKKKKIFTKTKSQVNLVQGFNEEKNSLKARNHQQYDLLMTNFTPFSFLKTLPSKVISLLVSSL